MILREIISDGLFETDSRTLLRKLAFLFGDDIDEDDRILHDGDYKWLYQIGNRRFFIPNMEMMYPLSYHNTYLFIVGWIGIFPGLFLASLLAD